MTEQNLDQIIKENAIISPIKKFFSFFRPTEVYLNSEQYCHIINQKTGKTKLVEGPEKYKLSYDEMLKGQIESKVIVPENQFCIINNPIKEGRAQYGEREIRKGPLSFPLHPGESLEKIQKKYVLTKYDGLRIKAITKINEHEAGDTFLLKGPLKYIPSKDEEVLEQAKAIPLSDTDGIYVQNKDTGDVRLVQGPADYFLEPNEQLFEKEMTLDELASLGLKEQRGNQGIRILTRQAANISYLKEKWRAVVLELENNEIVLLCDGSDQRIEKGPKTVLLAPYERPKVLTLSGGKPIQQGVLKISLLKLGPDFIYDQIILRTKDNAKIKVDVTYKWRFRLKEEDLAKAFTIDDFVGYAAETISSEIRAVAAKYDFEEFHANSVEYVKKAIFGKEKNSRLFEENNFEIFGVDITRIIPEDPEIANKLNEAIKSNMDIYCKKLVLKATLESERQEIEGKTEIEKQRKGLIELEIENQRKETIENAKINAETKLLKAENDAQSIQIIGKAEIEAEASKIKNIAQELSKQGAKEYLELNRIKSFNEIEKLVVVPTESKLVLPLGKQDYLEE